MPKNKKIRVSADPNGSGESTLQKNFTKVSFWKVFVNANEIERKLKDFKFIDLNYYGVIGDG